MEDVIVDVMGPSLLALAPAFACVHVLVEKATLSWGARLNAALPELQRICHHLRLALQFAQTSSSQQTQVCNVYCPCRMPQPFRCLPRSSGRYMPAPVLVSTIASIQTRKY